MGFVLRNAKPKKALIDVGYNTWEFIVKIKNDLDLLMVVNIFLCIKMSTRKVERLNLFQLLRLEA